MQRKLIVLSSAHYRPQTKFAKVMFLHLSVILFTGGVYPSMQWVRHLPPSKKPGRPPPRKTDTPPPGRQTPSLSLCIIDSNDREFPSLKDTRFNEMFVATELVGGIQCTYMYHPHPCSRLIFLQVI